MDGWFVNYAGALDVRKTFKVDAGTKADAVALGDTLAAAWLRQQGMVPGDLRGTPGEGAPAQLVGCWPVPPAWVGIVALLKRGYGVRRLGAHLIVADPVHRSDGGRLVRCGHVDRQLRNGNEVVKFLCDRS